MEEGRWEEGRPPLMRGMFADVFHAIQVNLRNISIEFEFIRKERLVGKRMGVKKFKFTKGQRFLSAKCIFGMTVAKTSQVVGSISFYFWKA